MRPPQLDERLTAAAALFSACDLGADIGADHGRLSCALLQSGQCKRMIVTDISANSLQKARDLLDKHGLSHRADFRQADGLAALMGDRPQCVAICGMGGRLISGMLARDAALLRGAVLVLCAHTDGAFLRRTLCDIGYRIDDERIARAAGRYYILMRAVPGLAQYTDKELYLGPALIREKPALWLDYLTWRRGVVARGMGHETRLQWIEEELHT